MDDKIISSEVLEFIRGNPACTFDELLKGCGEFTWEQLFYEVDRLRQLGQLRTYLKIVDDTKFHLYKSGHAAPA